MRVNVVFVICVGLVTDGNTSYLNKGSIKHLCTCAFHDWVYLYWSHRPYVMFYKQI